MIDPLVIIAVGGNSLIKDSAHMSVLDQYKAAGETAEHIAGLVSEGVRVLITHGNGPQVGFILLRSELAKDQLHQVPLESCVADTQGAIGYQIQQTLANRLRRQGIERPIAAVVTQVLVDPKDPAFDKPEKPIGPFLSAAEAKQHQTEDGWAVMEDAGRGWRRVVPSPAPLGVVEQEVIGGLLNQGVIVIAAGGGGIPVVRDAEGLLRGRPAVIDKDAAACLMAKNLGAEVMLVTTSVERVALNYRQPQQVFVDRMTVAEAKRYLAEGHFGKGSMEPKIEAAVDFLESGGRRVVICKPEALEDAFHRRAGTEIIP